MTRHNSNQVARGWKISKFSASPWMDRGILPILGLSHDDRHLLHRTRASEAPVREHHHVGVQRWGSSSWTNECKKRFQTHCENSRKSSIRTRTTEFTNSEERENEAKTIRWNIASRIRMDESKFEDLFLATFFLFIIVVKLVATRTRTSRLLMAWTRDHQWQDHQWRDYQWHDHQRKDHKWWIRRFLFSKVSRADIVECRARHGGWKQNTSSSVLLVFRTWYHSSHVHACVWLRT